MTEKLTVTVTVRRSDALAMQRVEYEKLRESLGPAAPAAIEFARGCAAALTAAKSRRRSEPVRDDTTPAPFGWHVERQGTEFAWWICDNCNHPRGCHDGERCTGGCTCTLTVPDTWPSNPALPDPERTTP